MTVAGVGRIPGSDSATDDELACQRAVELLTDYMEGALDAATAATLEGHLLDCAGCRAYLQQLHRAIDAVGQLTPPPPPPDVRAELVALYRRARSTEEKRTPPPGDR
jgi:anti-sigma factor RsiW